MEVPRKLLAKLLPAEIFNRFKPLFLAFKTKCPKTINKISKLSKTYHKPLVSNHFKLFNEHIAYSRRFSLVGQRNSFCFI